MAEKTLESEQCEYYHFDQLMEYNDTGYARYYLHSKWDIESLTNKARLNEYKTLLEIDNILGLKSEIQLWWCCAMAVHIDVIDVSNTYIICSLK